MNCPTCNYVLWNLPGRTCPECGTPFAPSQFKFVINSVRFCCPHCAQEYYGTGEDGHLEPRAFDCVRCHRHIDMDQMVLLPADGVPEAQTKADSVPWIDPNRRGFFGRLFGTLGMAIARPGRLALALPQPDRAPAALRFASIVLSVYALLGVGFFLVIMVAAIAGRLGPAMSIIAALLAIAVFPFVMALVVIFWALCSHAILRISGPLELGFSRTLLCLCYSSSTAFLVAIPCVSMYLVPFFWIWWSVSAAIMIALAHRVSGLRAALAAIIPPVVVLAVSIVAGYFFIVVPIRGFIATASAAMQSGQALQAQSKTKAVAVGLLAYQAANQAPPAHALDLILQSHLSYTEFFVSGFPFANQDRFVAGTDIVLSNALRPTQRTAAVRSAAALLPAGVVAHRLGDMVFTYHGIDLSRAASADPSLWVVICAPLGTSPAPTPFGAPPNTPQGIDVAALDGAVQAFTTATFPAALAAQNALRKSAGLAPLPDPMTIPAGGFATGASASNPGPLNPGSGEPTPGGDPEDDSGR